MAGQLLRDKIIFLTGGSRGIGYECAKAYAAEGASVIIFCPDERENKSVIAELGSRHLAITGDVADAVTVENAINQSISVYGRIDAIHNNAGIADPSKMLHETSEEEFMQLINVNLKGIFHTTKFGIEALKQTKGAILNTGSLVGDIGQEMHAVYAATKGAIHALTKSMALDYAKYNIRVNTVAPAGVWTPMLHQWNSEQPEDVRNDMSRYLDQIHPLGYCPEGDVVADACAFLLSAKARFITGCILPVSGGAELGYRTILKTMS